MSETENSRMHEAGEDIGQTIDGSAASAESEPETPSIAMPVATGVMSAAVVRPERRERQLHQAASAARESGKRIDLLHYLRLRRRKH